MIFYNFYFLIILDLFLIILDLFWPIFDHFWSFWTYFDIFLIILDLFWPIFDHFWPILTYFWLFLTNFGSFLTYFDLTFTFTLKSHPLGPKTSTAAQISKKKKTQKRKMQIWWVFKLRGSVLDPRGCPPSTPWIDVKIKKVASTCFRPFFSELTLDQP